MVKDTFYFPHDYNARNDPEMVKLTKLGWEYVGLYWAIIEMLHEQGGYLPNEPETYAFALHSHCDRIATLLNCGLFIIEGNNITSKRVLDNLKHREEVSIKARENARKRWGNEDNATALPPHSDRNARKGKERKGNRESAFVPPSLEAIQEYIKTSGHQVDAKKFYDYFTVSGWVDSKGKKVKNWKQKLITWASHNKQPIQEGFHKP